MNYTIIESMGRPRGKMTKALDSFDFTLQEHLWKIFAYHNSRPNDINTWLRSINNHLPQLILSNISKTKDLNYSKSQLRDRYTDEWFGTTGDIEALNRIWSTEGFPVVNVTEADRMKLVKFSNTFIDSILADYGKFKINNNLLL